LDNVTDSLQPDVFYVYTNKQYRLVQMNVRNKACSTRGAQRFSAQ